MPDIIIIMLDYHCCHFRLFFVVGLVIVDVGCEINAMDDVDAFERSTRCCDDPIFFFLSLLLL